MINTVTKPTDPLHMRTLSCMNAECQISLRVARVLNRPRLEIGALRYCPLCGQRAFQELDNAQVWSEALAQHYKLTPELIEVLYKEWNPHTHYRFADFVQEMLVNVANEIDKELV